jgi:hypothetical protein
MYSNYQPPQTNYQQTQQQQAQFINISKPIKPPTQNDYNNTNEQNQKFQSNS